MSYTAICVAGADGVLQQARVFRNVHGGAWFIWDALWRMYLPEGVPFAVATELERQQLWALDRDPRLNADEQIALISTFDYCLVRRTECHRVAEAFQRFLIKHERRRATGRACTLSLQAMFLQELCSNPEVLEVGWWQQRADGEPYNVLRGKDHWFLFDRYPDLR